MALCTTADVKAIIGRDDDEDDVIIATMCTLASNWIAADAGRFDHAAGRSLLEAFANRVEYHEGAAPFVDLAGFPIVGAIEVRSALQRDEVDTADVLTVNSEYAVKRTRVSHLEYGRDLFTDFTLAGGWVRVKYNGGWVRADIPDEEAPLPGYAEVPAALRQAAAFLAHHLFKNKENFGARSFNVGTATIEQVVRDLDVVGAITAVVNPLKSAARLGIG
jgi:hypothetical protein